MVFGAIEALRRGVLLL